MNNGFPQLSPRLTMQGVCKRFGATIALSGVDLTVAAGEVHALVGENGAGKSTLMKILAGAVLPDAGSITLDGEQFAPNTPLVARDAGVAMIYQELNLAEDLTVEQNMVLGLEHSACGMIRSSTWRERVRSVLAEMHHSDLRPGIKVRDLSAAARQLVEIGRALLADARIIVMDEPTSSLGLMDIEHLFTLIDSLRRRGVSIIYISHFLEEIQRVADRYTILRDGATVASGAMSDITQNRLVEHMIGRKLDEMFPRIPHEIGEPILTIDKLSGRQVPINASLTLHRGEILGLAGLVGAGRTELVRSLFGLDAIRSGTIRLEAIGIHRPDPVRSLKHGMGLLSEERQREGLAVSRSIAENTTLSHLDPFTRCGFVSLRAMHRATVGLIDQLGVRCLGPRQDVNHLSGGNQQKVAIARLLHHDVDILLLDEPTRGIDVASKAQIYRLIGELAAQGKAILLISSYTPELLGICDRIAVMHRGTLSAVRNVSAWTEHSIIACAAGGTETDKERQPT